jgi:hypothetical protein
MLAEPTKSPPAPKGVAFIPLREASCRSGVPMETLARKCRGEWSKMNMAAILAPADGASKPTWHVREDCDPRFARAQSPDHVAVDWSKLSDKQRATIQRRRAILFAWLDARADDFDRGYSERESTAAFVKRSCDDGLECSRGSLFRWFKAYQAAGLNGLADLRLVKSAEAVAFDPFIEAMKGYWLKPARYTKAMAYHLACERAEERGWSIPFDLRQAQNILAAIPKKVADYHREGPRAYNAKHGKFIERDYSKLASNQLWVSDGYTLDVRVNHGGKLLRPTLVAWMDVRSRYPVGWRIVPRAENADVILAAFRMGVEAHGLPQMVFHDNGDAYDAKMLQGVTKRKRREGALPQIDLGLFPRLEVGVRHSLPYNAKSKMNERWHRPIKERFCTRFETYTGGNPDEKPYDLADKEKAGKAPTLEEVVEAFGSWLIADYTMKSHGGADMDGSPAEVFAKHLTTKRVIDHRRLFIETARRELVKVGRNGVRWRGLTYSAPELDMMTGEEVQILIGDTNVNSVTVLYASGSQKGALICEAPLLRRLDVIADEADVRRDTKRVREAGPARIRLRDDPIERLNRIASQKGGDAPKPSPDALQPHQGDDGRPAMRIAGDEETPVVGSFGYYLDHAERRDNKAVNE